MPTNIQVIFYSLHGHVYQLAEAIAEGARQVPDSNVELFQVAETLSADVIANMGGTDTRKAFQHVPIAQIDHLRISRNRKVAADIANFTIRHDHNAVRDECFRFTIKHARRFQRNRLIRRAHGQDRQTGTNDECAKRNGEPELFHAGDI